MQKNSRSTNESVSVSVRCNNMSSVLANCKDGTIRTIVVLANQEAPFIKTCSGGSCLVCV